MELGTLWEVAVALPIFHTLTYRLPETLKDKARVGCPVRVPAKRQSVTGYLLGPAGEIPEVKIRPIQAVLDPLPRFGPEMVPLFRWLTDYYQYPLGEALDHLIPGAAAAPGPRTERWAAWRPQPEGTKPPPRLSPKAQGLIAHLRENGPVPLRELNPLFPNCFPILKRLAASGLVALEERTSLRDPLKDHPLAPEEPPLQLSPEQEEARAAIAEGIHSRKFSPFLLHGVTASGKTEVYLQAAQATLDQGRQVLVLLPEIALTHPVALAFRQRFGSRVALLHSGISPAARLDQWRRIILGQADIAVGARSAVFAPLPRLGLLVVDEEHDPAYKQEGGLLYQARDVALYRGKLAAAAVVLVSATPAVTSYYRAQEGKYRYLNLSRRVTPQALPEIHLISLKQHRSGRGLPVISAPLAAALEETLARGEQALLFLNRRGYATVLFCLFCGQAMQCWQCSVALTYHQARNVLTCHYCGYEERVPERCPQCQSTAIKRYGLGTERVEAEIQKIFPQARVARLDRDTAPHSGRALKVLEDFAAGRYEILVGTQMISKGHHFPGVPGGGDKCRSAPLLPRVPRGGAHLSDPQPGGGPGGPWGGPRQGLDPDLPPGPLCLPGRPVPGLPGFCAAGTSNPPGIGLSPLHPAGPGPGEWNSRRRSGPGRVPPHHGLEKGHSQRRQPCLPGARPGARASGRCETPGPLPLATAAEKLRPPAPASGPEAVAAALETAPGGQN